MMPNEKDRFGDKLREVERGREDEYFAKRDRELVSKLKAQTVDQQQKTLKELARRRCPRDGEHLVTKQHLQVSFEECPRCKGMWLDHGELEILASRNRNGWLARYLGLGT